MAESLQEVFSAALKIGVKTQKLVLPIVNTRVRIAIMVCADLTCKQSLEFLI
jgi:hypothetical protein